MLLMMTLAAHVVALAILAAGSPGEPPAPITTGGWGRVRVGMSRLAASRALGGDLRLAEGKVGKRLKALRTVQQWKGKPHRQSPHAAARG